MGRRAQRLTEEIREQVARMIASDLKDPRLGFVTVTRVEMTHDLGLARVHVGVLGSEAEREKTMKALGQASGFVRRELGKRLRIRHTPEVEFRYDKGLDATDRVAQLLDDGAPARRGARGAGRRRDGERRRGEAGVAALVDGVLVVDKPAGPTSHDIVDRARRALGTRRVGHTGTLDPFATGVLPLCLGRATRLARFLTAGEKTYRATLRLGFATTTDDLTGEPLGEPRRVELTDESLRAALAGLVGRFDQVPPAFSARQVDGRRLYELARRGEATARAATPVEVQALDLVSRAGDTLELEVRCSAGTYVRAIARDLGEQLGCGAHLVALRRTRSGGFGLDQAVPGDSFERAASA